MLEIKKTLSIFNDLQMSRSFGLDFLRSIAITLVIIEHLSWFLLTYIQPNVLHSFTFIGLFGVELFFILSGFLIGNIVLRIKFENLRSDLLNFYIRRWMRTLPLYFLAIIIFELISFLISKEFAPHWHYYFFLQNFTSNSAEFFGVSWSLVIEEWFYLILPLLIYVFTKNKTMKKKLLLSLVVSVLLLNAIRILFVWKDDPLFDSEIRKSVLYHLDPLFVGVILALIQKDHPHLYNKLYRINIMIFANFTLIVFAFYYMYLGIFNMIDQSFFLRTFSFPLIALCMAINLIFFEKNSFINKTMASKKIVFYSVSTISLISYSLYVWHYEIDKYLSYLGRALDIPLLMIPLAIFLSIALSILSFIYIEKPFLNIRNRITPRK